MKTITLIRCNKCHDIKQGENNICYECEFNEMMNQHKEAEEYFNTQPAEESRQYIKDYNNLTEKINDFGNKIGVKQYFCPDCDTHLTFQEGCSFCPACGWSDCH